MVRSKPASVAVDVNDLSIERVSGRGGDTARVVDGVTFTLERANTLVLMGPTGSGKSSLAAMLAGHGGPDMKVVGGDARVEGISIRKGGHPLRQITYHAGFLAQGDAARLAPRSTVAEIIAEPVTSRDRRANARAIAVRVATLLDEFALPLGMTSKYPYELSAGMRQRVALARAFMLEPRLLIADDAFANLDVDSRRLVREAIMRRRDERGMAAVLVTNDTDAVNALDPYVLVLRAGHPIAFGRGTKDLLWTPSSEADSRLVAPSTLPTTR
ncbi:peptide/nickel transport system ATP-binding protein [Microbacterium halimionae]|uniref:Peptide/nickel transport system ATP-binding protein n=1 Tax=Microbacterium halimionae TaxID=1526413 RepID=A0A7W3JNE4_9MICO|nr:ATP-binding cassette domain-containing protein [Microbacterium halimionae]MBA8816038.1 peptide/nickel transport system ATP-binding protein [Microbacterium halimionae]NII96240.1 peptide/nickel transport system ATP-binding protein [Microbacterium halimionae]